MRGYFTDDVQSYSRADCEEYIRKDPDGKYIGEVKKRLEELIETETEEKRIAAKRRRSAAKRRRSAARRSREDDELWNNCKNSLDGIDKYKTTYPQGRHIKECDAQVEKLNRKTEDDENSVAFAGKVICGIIGGIMGIILWIEFDIGFRGGLFCVVGIGWLGSVIGYGIGWVIDKLFYN